MTRSVVFAAFFAFSALPAPAQENRPAAAAPLAVAPAKVEPAYYYPPAGSSQPPLSAREVCRSLRSGLSGLEVAQDVRERGFLGGFSQDEAADARAAGASPELVAALQAGRFTVSPGYTQRHSEAAAGGTAAMPTRPASSTGSSRHRRPAQTQGTAALPPTRE